MTDKEEIKTEHLARELGLTETTAKRYLRQFHIHAIIKILAYDRECRQVIPHYLHLARTSP